MNDTGAAAPRDKHTPRTTSEAPEVHVLDAIRNSAAGFVFDAMHAFGRTTTERRIAKRLHKVQWALEHRQGDLTPAQLQAVAMLYGCEMPPAQCARRLGITRQAFIELLQRAEAAIDRLYDQGGRRRWKKGRPNAQLTSPEGAEWMTLRARETLGAGAAFIDPNAKPREFTDEYERWVFEGGEAPEGSPYKD